MAIQRKGESNLVIPSAEYPEQLPRFSEEVVKRFPSLRDFQDGMDRWWFDFRTVLQRQLQQSELSNADSTTDLTALQEQISPLNNQINALTTSLNSLTTTVNAILSSGDNELLEALAAHIAATSAHGTTGQVVGTTDEQSLEAKTIGFNQPRSSRFKSVATSSVINVTETVDVPAGYHMIVAMPFEINGVLNIDGTLLFL